MKEKILAIIREIRTILNSTYEYNELSKDTKKFNICCSALDILRDTSEAVDYYKNNDFVNIDGFKYLMIHGILQVLYIQQDALCSLNHVFNSTEIDFKTTYPEIYNIRETRNDITGHPTDRGKYSTYLNRNSIEKNAFSYFQNSTKIIENFNILEAINIQENFLYNFLEKFILKILQEKEKMHFEYFRDKKIAIIFDKNYSYTISKLRDNNDIIFDYSLTSLIEVIEKLKITINERFTNWQETDFSYDINKAEKTINFLRNKLKDYNNCTEDFELIRTTFIDNLITIFKNMEKLAKEIDEYYEDYFISKPLSENNLTDLKIKINGEDDELNI